MVKLRRLFALAILTLFSGAWCRHPIHAARIEVDLAPGGTVMAVVHVYRDDFPATATLAEIGAYLDRSLVLTDARGGRVALHATGMEPEGDRLRIALTGMAAGGLKQGRIALTLLQERFADQVNVVDVRVPGRRAQLVFLRGDGPQSLP